VLYRNDTIEESGVTAVVFCHPATEVAWLARKLDASDQPQARRHSARHFAPSTPKSGGALTRLVFQPQPDPSTPATSR